MLSDNIHNKIVNHELSILESGRIGVNKEAFDEVYKPFMKKKILEHLEYSISSFKRNSSLIIQGETNIDISMYGEAFEEEFGLSLLEIMNFYNFLTDFGFELEVAAPSLNLSDLKLKLKEILKWDNKTIDRAIKLFSLFPRKRWDIPPNGFERNDIWPWRYNRRLSYIRRPLIIGPIVDDNSLVFWGPRHVEEAFENFVELVRTGRYNVPNNNISEKMNLLIGTIKNEKGKRFNQKVEQWFLNNTDYKVDHEIPIKPGEKLSSEIDLGDIDVLVIDEINKKILLVECKSLNYGRNPQEIANEIGRLIGEIDDDNSWTKKHIKRHKWVEANINALAGIYGFENEEFFVYSIFIVSNEIPAPYIRSMPLPFVSYSQLLREGVSSLGSFSEH